MEEFPNILGLPIKRHWLIKKVFFDILEKNKEEDTLFTLQEGFTAKFLELDTAQFYSLYSIFSEKRHDIIREIKEENKIETEFGTMYPIVFMLPIALMDKDLEIMREGGFEFKKRIENIFISNGINVENPDEFLSSKENQIKILKILIDELEKENISLDDIFWYLLLVYIIGGYSALKYKNEKGGLNK